LETDSETYSAARTETRVRLQEKTHRQYNRQYTE
jgi:hypothetical protein